MRKDCSIIWLSALSNRVEYDEQPAVQGMFLDVNESKKTGEILRESEERYRELANSLPDIVFESDTSGKLVFANERALEIAGISHQDFEKGLNILQFVAPEDRQRAMESIQRLLAGGSYVPAEYVFLRKDGTTFPALITTTLRISKNKVTGLRGLAIDITERKKAEEVVRKSEQRYRELANSLPETVLEADLTGKITFLSQRAFDITGFSREELEKGLNMLSFVVPEERERAIENIKKSMAGGAHGANEYTLLRKNGTTFPALVRTNPIISENKVTGLRGLVIDITERKKNEDTLRQNEEQFRQLFSNMPSGVAIYEAVDNGEDFVFRGFNAAAEKIEKINKDDVLGKRVTQVFASVKSFGIFEVFQRVWRTGQPEYFPAALYKDDKEPGSWRENWVYRLPNGNIITIYNDITDRKKLEAAIKEKLDMLEALTENIGAGFVTISKDYRVLYANRFVKNNCGNVEGKQCYATLNTLDHICPDCGVKKVFEDGVARDSHEYSQIGINGEPYYVELIATPLKDKDGNVTAALEFVVDIAEKKRMQQKLQANEAKFRAISDSAIDAIFMFNEEDTITYWNPAAARIFGYTEKEIIGQKVDMTIVPPRYREDHLGLKTKLAKGENKNIEGEILEFPGLRKDETEFPMEFSITSLQLNSKQHFVAIARDITERKKAEEALIRSMDELVLVNEKLNVVGSLTRHDVRNKLLAVTGNAFLLKKKHPDQPDIIDRLGKMEQACTEIGAILDFAKMYEQLGVEELTYIDVEKTLNEALALFSGSLNVKVINDCHGLTLLADSFLRQLFFNLMDNSVKHGKKVTTIKATYEKVDQDRLNLIYEDDGIGISVQNKPQLFKEGFSTGGSSGYGLYLIRKMMEVYGWAIKENGESDKGAKFVITIPMINQKGNENFRIA